MHPKSCLGGQQRSTGTFHSCFFVYSLYSLVLWINLGRRSGPPIRNMAIDQSGSSFEPPSHVLYPKEFGADPTGKNDSAPAFDAMLAAAWKLRAGGGGTGHGEGTFTNGPELSVVMDLQGGSYVLSRPLYFPAEGGGGIMVRDGVIRASATFRQDKPGAVGDDQLALLMLTKANGTSTDDGACCWYEFIYFSNLVLDASLRTGCARIHSATRIVFDETFFTGFATTGLYYGGSSHQVSGLQVQPVHTVFLFLIQPLPHLL
jgi:hypothetical protein